MPCSKLLILSSFPVLKQFEFQQVVLTKARSLAMTCVVILPDLRFCTYFFKLHVPISTRTVDLYGSLVYFVCRLLNADKSWICVFVCGHWAPHPSVPTRLFFCNRNPSAGKQILTQYLLLGSHYCTVFISTHCCGVIWQSETLKQVEIMQIRPKQCD